MDGIGALVGKTIARMTVGDETIDISCEDGSEYRAYHLQDCCEMVHVYDVAGDVQSLIGVPIVEATEEVETENWPDDVPRTDDEIFVDDSFTWTTYRLRTERGQVVIRWFGTSNGYYSESVHFGLTHAEVR